MFSIHFIQMQINFGLNSCLFLSTRRKLAKHFNLSPIKQPLYRFDIINVLKKSQQIFIWIFILDQKKYGNDESDIFIFISNPNIVYSFSIFLFLFFSFFHHFKQALIYFSSNVFIWVFTNFCWLSLFNYSFA